MLRDSEFLNVKALEIRCNVDEVDPLKKYILGDKIKGKTFNDLEGVYLGFERSTGKDVVVKIVPRK